MAFKRVTTLDGAVIPFEYYLVTDSEAITLGEALVQTSGRLTKCAATAVPEFVAEKTVAAGINNRIPVTRVREEDEFITTSIATVASTLVGAKVTLHTDGLQVTGTTVSGVFLVSYTDGVTTTSTVRGYFRR